jgi:signal transduction histidine kinase
VKFLDDLRAYLERPLPPRSSFVPDVAAHRRHLLDSLEALEKQRRNAGASRNNLEEATELREQQVKQDKEERAIRRLHGYWSDGHLADFVRGVARALGNGLGHGAASEEIERLVNIAIDRDLGLSASTGSYAKDMELDRLIGEYARDESQEPSRIDRYALAVRAVRRVDGGRVLTPIGKLIPELPDRDALRWMLAAEVVQSDGQDDEWRLSREGAANLLRHSEGWRYYGDTDQAPWPVRGDVFDRLSQTGIVKLTDHADHDVVSYELLPQGRILLEEVASENDTPFILLARAMLQDETAAVLGQSPAASLVRQENAAAVATRHARMVAHEIRNALVPLQVGLRNLYEAIEQSGQADLLEDHREPIDAGVARIFRFVRDIARVADLATTPDELFDIAPVVEVARAAVKTETGGAVAFVKEAELPLVFGHRDRFVLVLVNLLRNAVQARKHPPVRVQITAGVNNGAEVFVRVDDDGPGVGGEDRARLFSHGFSRRPGGSGQGLAFVREVVEAEMAGRVAYEESPLGGARFVIRLPVGTRRST